MEVFDLATEPPISLSEAANYLPAKPDGKKISIRTLERWIRHGHKKVKLQAVKVGSQLVTSKESLARFGAKLSGGSLAKRSPTAASRSHAKAKEFLRKQGVGGTAKRERAASSK